MAARRPGEAHKAVRKNPGNPRVAKGDHNKGKVAHVIPQGKLGLDKTK